MRAFSSASEISKIANWESEFVEFICEVLRPAGIDFESATLEISFRSHPWPSPLTRLFLTTIYSRQGSIYSLMGFPAQTPGPSKVEDFIAHGPLKELPGVANRIVEVVKAVLNDKKKLVVQGQIVTGNARQVFELEILPQLLRLRYLGPIRGNGPWGWSV